MHTIPYLPYILYMPHTCGDLDVPVISVCGSEILMEKFDIQKLVVYATDLDEKIPVAPVFGPLGPEMVKSRIGIKN